MNHPSRVLRLFALLLAAFVGVGILAGCGSTAGSGGDATYSLAAYGQQNGTVFDCYFVDDPGEVQDLIQAGLCPANSVAVLAPLAWREEYWAYYSSPAYYDTYMPVSYRSHYTSVTIISFSKTYSKQISTAESKAVYKSSTGGTVAGSKVNTKQFGSGTRSGTTYGGGTRNGGSSTVKSGSGTTGGSRSGTSSGSKSGSYGGGSRH